MRHSEFGIEPYEVAAPLADKQNTFLQESDGEDEGCGETSLPQPLKGSTAAAALLSEAIYHHHATPAKPAEEQAAPLLSGSFRKTARSWQKVTCLVLIFTSLWWIAAILVIIEIKTTVVHGGIFPHPFALTSIVQPCTGLAAWLLSKLVGRKHHRKPLPDLTWFEVGVLCLMGALQGLEIGLTNKALEYLSVAGRTMISATSVLFMMTTARIWGLERLGCLRLIAATFLILGGALQGYGQQSSQGSFTAGIIMQVTSMFLSSQRWALAQFILQRSHPDTALGRISKLQLLSRTLPITGVICLPIALCVEPGAYTVANLSQPLLHLRICIIAAALAGMLYAELKLVKLLSAVAFNVLATIHQIPIVMAGVILQHNHVDKFSTYGFGACLLGALVYAAARQQDRHASTEH
mmetsp:Transcript_43672/g.93485  ORF Transcript_43672/g.93485 Transcript_43672/m.93485 type:complete len:408 (+) Transcript_43672:133-1356(+)